MYANKVPVTTKFKAILIMEIILSATVIGAPSYMGLSALLTR